MANNRNNFIYIVELEGYLTDPIKTQYNKEDNILELMKIKTTKDLISSLRLTKKQAKGTKGKLAEYDYTAVIINPFTENTIYELRFELHNNIELNYRYNKTNVSLDRILSLEENPTNYKSDSKTFHFNDKKLMIEFLLKRLEYVNDYNIMTSKEGLEYAMDNLSNDKSIAHILRDHTINKILED